MSIGSRAARAGGTGTAVLVLLLIGIAILALGTWWWTKRSATERTGPAPGAAAPASAERAGGAVPGPAGVAPTAPPSAPTPGTGAAGAPEAGRAPAVPPARTGGADDEARFAGRGRLRGSISAAGGASLPEKWTLVLRPGAMVPGREHAEARELELGAADTEFVVEDVPLGGYEVTARAPGRNASVVPIVLDRGHRDGYVTLQLRPAGFLDGFVQEEGGEALAGLLVRLESVADGTWRETRTDANGGYRFDDVLDGPYRLHFGSGEPPVLPARSLVFSAPSMRFPTTTAPRLARLAVRVLAAGGGPLPGAEVILEGPTGRVSLRTDADGRATALLLRPGPHRLVVQLEGYAPRVDELSFEEGEHAEAEVELRRE